MTATTDAAPGAAIGAWAGLAGQHEAIALLRQAAALGTTNHAWLITGPPGSGRSNLAYAFAAALLSREGPDGDPATSAQVAARTHPDLLSLSSEKVVIAIDEVRELVSRAQFSPSVGRYRVVVIEDADRMPERTSNVLLKSLEEPPERTVWVLCAPSEADLLPTIRSRVRSVRLRVPAVADVARLLETRDGIDPITAEAAARLAQSHIGMARRLATNPEVRARRDETIDIALGIRSVSAAVMGAARLLEIAGADGTAMTEERDDDERADFLHTLGVEAGAAVPSQLRSQVRQLEDDQKRRATRGLRDGLDRILVDLLSVFRDLLMIQLDSSLPLVNAERRAGLEAHAGATSPAQSLAVMDAIGVARERIASNVAPTLALEALLVTAIVTAT